MQRLVPGKTHPSVAKLDIERITADVRVSIMLQFAVAVRMVLQVRFPDIQDGLPCIEALCDKYVKVLQQAQVLQFLPQVGHEET